MANQSTTLTDWNINTDIYNISDNMNNLLKRYIEDEDETTLSMGIFGFVSDTESKKIQIATIMAGQLGNEMFPTRAKLTKNVLTHAVYHNIEGINAKPAQLTITLCIKMKDLEEYIVDNHFYLEADCPIFLEKYEFHLDYDVMITRKKVTNGWSYSAQYVVYDENDEKIINRLSDITHPYLKQPFIIKIGSDDYIGIQCTVRQCTIEKIDDVMISDSIIENKSYEFQFDNQMADFTIKVTENGKEFNITPYLYGMNVDDTEYYCWYLYVAADTIRITFDSRSFIPSLNSKIAIKSWTTLGANGNFEYLNSEGIGESVYVDLTSTKYNYRLITAYMEALTDSVNGSDRKTKEQLQKLIPRAALARGSVTTESDLESYFDLINNNTNRLVMQKKVDNQLARVWYGYFLLKDDINNIIPSNTIDIRFVLNSEHIVKCDDGRYIMPAGTVLKYDPETKLADPIDDSKVPPLNMPEYYDGYYYYMTIYNTVLCRNPLHCAYYLTNRNNNSYFLYSYVNDESNVQFIANHFHFERLMLIDQDTYSISFTIAQSIIDNALSIYSYEDVTYTDTYGNEITETIVTQNVKVVIVLYSDDGITPYRWIEATLTEVNTTDYYYSFKAEMVTDSQFDDLNRIKILGANEAGSQKTMYGFFGEQTRMDIYILARIPAVTSIDHPRVDLDNIAPGYDEYVVTNIYTAVEGISFYSNYTDVLNTKVVVDENTDSVFYISGVPVVGRHYMVTETDVKYLIEAITERKAYIDYCLKLIENNMNIDFKFFNTYGPSSTYTLEDKETFIGNVDLTMRFKVALRDESDIQTKEDIIKSIKAMVEDLYDTGDWHSSNLIQDIMNEYEDRIYFIEFVGFNKFDADDQHIIKVPIEDPTTVPEFLCIRNILNPETLLLDPCIDIETVS